MIYPGIHDTIEILLDSYNGDYYLHERKFYDCQVRKCHINYALLLIYCHFEFILKWLMHEKV